MNSYELNNKKERRFSLKIVVHKIRANLPNWVYENILKWRLLFFTKDCAKYKNTNKKIIYSDGLWINRDTTYDLKLIQSYLSTVKNKSILQVGTGNMSLYKTLDHTARPFYGITILKEEEKFGKSVIKQRLDKRSEVYLWDKYTGDFNFLNDKKVDFIVDNDISSYACCVNHFKDMLKAYSQIINPNGSILVGLKGLGYFDSGFGLTIDMLNKYLKPYGLWGEEKENFFQIKKVGEKRYNL